MTSNTDQTVTILNPDDPTDTPIYDGPTDQVHTVLTHGTYPATVTMDDGYTYHAAVTVTDDSTTVDAYMHQPDLRLGYRATDGSIHCDRQAQSDTPITQADRYNPNNNTCTCHGKPVYGRLRRLAAYDTNLALNAAGVTNTTVTTVTGHHRSITGDLPDGRTLTVTGDRNDVPDGSWMVIGWNTDGGETTVVYDGPYLPHLIPSIVHSITTGQD